jgi:hypothetical protein
MAPFVTSGSTIACSMSLTTAALVVPNPMVKATTPAGTIVNSVPTTNIPTFGMCMSLGNPQVATATTGNQGVLTPQPCAPATGSPWTGGSLTAKIAGIPCLLATSTCQCAFGGTITVITPAQVLANGT